MKKNVIGLLLILVLVHFIGFTINAAESDQGRDFAKKLKLAAGAAVYDNGVLDRSWNVISCVWSGNRYEIKLKGIKKYKIMNDV